jgi:peptide/nickel transport system ATP-binding protein
MWSNCTRSPSISRSRTHEPTAQEAPLLEVTDLRKHFRLKSTGLLRPREVLKAVDGVSFRIERGASLGLVGESGCGETTTGRVLARLYEPDGGSIRLAGTEIAHLTASICDRCGATSR